jgi:hypothetical protein
MPADHFPLWPHGLTSHQLLNQLTRENLRKRFKKAGRGVKAGKAMIKTESVAAKRGAFPIRRWSVIG